MQEVGEGAVVEQARPAEGAGAAGPRDRQTPDVAVRAAVRHRELLRGAEVAEEAVVRLA